MIAAAGDSFAVEGVGRGDRLRLQCVCVQCVYSVCVCVCVLITVGGARRGSAHLEASNEMRSDC